MGRRGRRPYGAVAVASLLLATVSGIAPAELLAYPGGPPDGRTGGPGEKTCNDSGCHNSFALNSGEGKVDLAGLPAAGWRAGGNYTLTLAATHPTAQRWGFEMTSLAADEKRAGSFFPGGGDTQTSVSSERQYIKHTFSGTQKGKTGSASWSFAWLAPAKGSGEVAFWAAVNMEDGDDTPSGDYVYTYNLTVPEDPTGPPPPPPPPPPPKDEGIPQFVWVILLAALLMVALFWALKPERKKKESREQAAGADEGHSHDD